MGSELVGRERELAVLSTCLDDALSGRPRLVLCRGEPGIGKTRLAQELCTSAAEKEVPAVWGAAEDFAGAPPYWPWRQILRAMSAVVDISAIAQEYRLAADLSPLVPDVFAEAGDHPIASASIEDRFRQFDAVGDLLRHATLERPLVMVFDDMHWADEPSLRLLQHVTRGLTSERVLLVVNQRGTEHARWHLLAELLMEPVTMQLDLRGLSAALVGSQLTAVVGHEVAEEEIAQVHSLTAGNPFFVAELGRVLAERQAGGSPPRVTTSARDLITARLNRLSPECMRLLAAASILGQEFSLAVVAAMVDQPVLDCLRILDEATAAGMVERAATPAQQRFSHALVRDAIEAGLGTPERVQLHRRAAEAVEKVHTQRLEPHVVDLARHWEIAAVLGDSGRAAGWIERAAEAAMHRHAYEEAARLFRAALEVGTAELSGTGRARLLLGLGVALNLSSDLPGALAACQEVSSLAGNIGSGQLLAQAALVVKPTMLPDVDIIIRQLCETAMQALGPQDVALHARVTAQFAVACDNLGDVEGARRASAEALALAEQCADRVALVAALEAAQLANASPDGVDQRASLAERILVLGQESSDRNAELWGHLWRIDVAVQRGDLADAGRLLDAAALCIQEAPGRMAQWQLLRCKALLAQAQARFDEAGRLAAEAFAVLAPTGHPLAPIVRSALLASMGHHIGYDGDALAANGLAQAPVDGQAFPTQGVIRALAPAWVLSNVGRLDEAASIYRSLGPVTGWRPTHHATLFAYAFGVGVAVALDASDDVASLHELLNPYRGHHVVSGSCSISYFGPVELWLGVAAAYLDQLDDAIVDLEQAMKASAANGAAGFEVEAQYELAAVLARRARAGDPARASSLVAGSMKRAGSLGMAPIAAKAARLIEELDRQSSAALTPREREVADLVAQGLTNREIAERLFLSERTAENHVQHILTKLDLANRSQIGMWVYAGR